MPKVLQIVINYCNDRCPHYYKNYEDGDAGWCAKINQKIHEADDSMAMFDFSSRKIPDICQLEDFK